MAAPMRSTDFRSIVEPILNECFDGVYDQRTDEWSRVFREQTGIPRNYHEEPVLYGFGAAPQLPDGTPVSYQQGGMQLFGDDRGLGVGAQGRCGDVLQQRRVVDGLRRGRDGITEADVDLQGQAGAFEPGAQIDAHAALSYRLSGVLADRAALDRRGIEDDAVVHCNAGERSENADQRGYVVRAEAQQIGVACRPVRLAVPELEQQRALEQETRCVLKDGKSVEQAFQAVPGQGQVEVLLRRVGVLLQPGADRCSAIGGHAVMASM